MQDPVPWRSSTLTDIVIGDKENDCSVKLSFIVACKDEEGIGVGLES